MRLLVHAAGGQSERRGKILGLQWQVGSARIIESGRGDVRLRNCRKLVLATSRRVKRGYHVHLDTPPEWVETSTLTSKLNCVDQNGGLMRTKTPTTGGLTTAVDLLVPSHRHMAP